MFGKWVNTPAGPRPHQWGDNQHKVMWSFPSWQRDHLGTDVLFSGRWCGGGQYWRLWEMPRVWHGDFPGLVCRAAGGKPRGNPIWIADADWG